MALVTTDLTPFFTRVSPAWEFDSTGLYSQVAAGVPRAGIDPATGIAAGLLIENNATNLFPLQVFSSGAGITQTPTIDRNGGTTARDMTTSLAGGNHYTERGITLTAGITSCFGLDIKAGTSNVAGLRMYGTGNAFFGANFTLTGAGSVVAATPSVEYTSGGGTTAGIGIKYMGAGWYRCWIAGVPDTAATTRLCRIMAFDPTGTTTVFTGDGLAACTYEWPQLETNGIPTSYIPTPSGSVTRNSEGLAFTGSTFTSLFGAGTSGFVIADVQIDFPSTVQRNAIQLDDGTASNRIELRPSVSTTTSLVAVCIVGGSQTVVPGQVANAFAYGPGTLGRIGLRWTPTGVAICANGSALQSATGAMPPLAALRVGSAVTGNSLYGRVLRVQGGAFAPSDARFQAACVQGANIDTAVRS